MLILAAPSVYYALGEDVHPELDKIHGEPKPSLEKQRATVWQNQFWGMIQLCLSWNVWWLLEFPASSFLFQLPGVANLLRRKSVSEVTTDMCCFGLRDPSGAYYQKHMRLLEHFPDWTRLEKNALEPMPINVLKIALWWKGDPSSDLC